MDKETGIYKITNKVNGKYYIGQSIDIYRRWEDEKHFVSVNKHLQNAFKKYGFDNFSFEILEECSEELLNDREIYYISLLEATNNKKGYNMTFGGTGGKLSEEVIERIKETKKKNGYTKYWLGKSLPTEMKQKISNSLSGDKNPNFNKTGENSSNSRKVVCIETNQVFNTLKEAALFVGLKISSNIGTAIRTNRKAGGYHWMYLTSKPKVKNLTTNEIFNSISEAAEATGLDVSSLRKVCKGQRKTCGGFEWGYI